MSDEIDLRDGMTRLDAERMLRERWEEDEPTTTPDGAGELAIFANLYFMMRTNQADSEQRRRYLEMLPKLTRRLNAAAPQPIAREEVDVECSVCGGYGVLIHLDRGETESCYRCDGTGTQSARCASRGPYPRPLEEVVMSLLDWIRT